MVYTPQQNTVAPLPPGATDMRSASIANTNSVAAKQNELNQMAGSRKRKGMRRFRGGATTGTITVPVVPNPVPETGIGANTTSANITNSTKVGAAENANSKYDACVGQGASCGMAGGRKRSTLKGGWPSWGCMSGGVSRRKKGSRKRRKGRKTRRGRGRKSK